MYLLYYTSAMLLKNSRNVFLLKGVLAIDTVMVEERERPFYPISDIGFAICTLLVCATFLSPFDFLPFSQFSTLKENCYAMLLAVRYNALTAEKLVPSFE